MEQHTDLTHSQMVQKKKTLRWTLLAASIIVAITATVYGVNNWHQNKISQEKILLQNRIAGLETKLSKAKLHQESQQKPKHTVYYKTKIGSLAISLPDEYAIIVAADGNKGGAPGSTLKIGKVSSDGTISDGIYSWVQLEVWHSGDNELADSVRGYTSILTGEGFENIEQQSATVAGMPAIKLTADGWGYAGHREVYIVVSGDFTYEVVSSNQAADKPGMLKDTLEGIKITPVKFQ